MLRPLAVQPLDGLTRRSTTAQRLIEPDELLAWQPSVAERAVGLAISARSEHGRGMWQALRADDPSTEVLDRFLGAAGCSVQAINEMVSRCLGRKPPDLASWAINGHIAAIAIAVGLEKGVAVLGSERLIEYAPEGWRSVSALRFLDYGRVLSVQPLTMSFKPEPGIVVDTRLGQEP
jgi:hypothetical protein